MIAITFFYPKKEGLTIWVHGATQDTLSFANDTLFYYLKDTSNRISVPINDKGIAYFEEKPAKENVQFLLKSGKYRLANPLNTYRMMEKVNKIEVEVFKTDIDFKVLILPFLKEYQGINFGKYISKRLEETNEKEQLGFTIEYAGDKYAIPENFNEEKRQKILQDKNAHFLVYGMQEKGDTCQYACVNYTSKENSLGYNSSAEFKPTNIINFSKGHLQGEIDLVIFKLIISINNTKIRIIENYLGYGQLRFLSELYKESLQNKRLVFLNRVLNASRHIVNKLDKNNFDYLEYMALMFQYISIDSVNSYAERLIYSYPNKPSGFIFKAIVLTHQQKYEEALKKYKQAIQINFNNVDIYYNRGNLYVKKKEYENAIKDFSQAIKLKPNSVNSHYNRGRAYVDMKDYTNAFNDFNKVINLEKNYSSAYSNRGYIYKLWGDYAKAIEDFTICINISPYSYVPYYNRGNCYFELGEYDMAMEDYKKVIAINPNIAKIYIMIAFYYAINGNYSEAQNNINKSYSLIQFPENQSDIDYIKRMEQEIKALLHYKQ